MANRKCDDGVGPSSCKKSKAPMSLLALRQATRLALGAIHPSIVQDVIPAPPVIKARAVDAATPITSAPSPCLVVAVQKATPTTTKVSVLATFSHSDVASSSTIVAPLLCVSVTTTSALVSTFDKNLIRSAGVQNAMDSAKVFIKKSLAILEENGQRHQEALHKVASLEVEVAKWRVTTHTVWRMEGYYSIGSCRPRIFFINGFLCFLEDEWQWNGEGKERGDANSRRR